jgi:hypothetical protein
MKTTAVFLLISCVATAQVDEIKEKSKSSTSEISRMVSSTTSSSDNSTGSNFLVDVVSFAFIGWQATKLQKKDSVPGMVSLELMTHVAIQPSTYYLINPRIRGNWGLVSTDFRFNYIIEESLEATRTLRTDDWQIIQLNLVTTRYVGFRLGVGILHEAYSGGDTFTESTAALTFQTRSLRWAGLVEHRWSEPRMEWNANVQKKIFESRVWHGYASFGFAYQRYYDSIDVWGVQLGVVVKVFK